jgi:hypothetical protein
LLSLIRQEQPEEREQHKRQKKKIAKEQGFMEKEVNDDRHKPEKDAGCSHPQAHTSVSFQA